MWRRLVRALALVVLLLTTTLAAVPADTVAEQTCKSADGHLRAGSLDRAKKLYESVRASDGDQQCAVDGLRLVAEARQDAAELVTAGQLLIRSGDLNGAEDKFDAALHRDAASVAAGAGIARVADLKSHPLPTALSQGDRFYRDWGLPLGRLLLLIAIGGSVLYAFAGLSSRWLVKVDVVVWPKRIRHITGSLGALLLFAAAVMAPLFAMFSPFTPTWTQCRIGVLVLAVVCLGAAALVLCGARSDAWKQWRALLLALGIVTLAGILSVLLASALSYDVRLMFVHIALSAVGVLLTAAAFGQNLRLQVEVQQPDGNVNAASSEYLLARMKGLGTETPQSLHKTTSTPGSTPLSQIPVEELSVLPAGKIVGTLTRLFFALRPDLTWRARVTLVDDDRLAAALSRNGQHAASAVFSRPDLTLPEDDDKDRAKAQMLTGAAAFILVQLSAVHKELRDGLYGASHWKSVALQVIASSKSLLAADENRVATQVKLFAKAVNEDPGNELARFECLWAAYEYMPYAETDFGAFARAIDRQYDSLEISKTRDDQEGWMPLKIRILYNSATQWLNAYINASSTSMDHAAMLNSARKSAGELDRLCGEVSWKGKELQRQQTVMRPHARNLVACLDALHGSTEAGENTAAQHPHEGAPASPRLAYDHACLHMFIARRRDLGEEARQQQWGYAIEDLRHALVTEDNKKDAQGDPCFAELRSNSDFQELVRIRRPRPPRRRQTGPHGEPRSAYVVRRY
ncbi:hypothetical protein ABZ442_14835 [Streptomyces triculaminicus]|uniref:hypothetical protein n=1 Tax=Streptomyces triculaminicus TaxID=2816232 RepID=UPI0033D9B424